MFDEATITAKHSAELTFLESKHLAASQTSVLRGKQETQTSRQSASMSGMGRGSPLEPETEWLLCRSLLKATEKGERTFSALSTTGAQSHALPSVSRTPAGSLESPRLPCFGHVWHRVRDRPMQLTFRLSSLECCATVPWYLFISWLDV